MTDAAWSGWTVAFFLLLCMSFAALAAVFIASRISATGKRFAASRWGQAIILVVTVSIFGVLGSLVLPQFFATT